MNKLNPDRKLPFSTTMRPSDRKLLEALCEMEDRSMAEVIARAVRQYAQPAQN